MESENQNLPWEIEKIIDVANSLASTAAAGPVPASASRRRSC